MSKLSAQEACPAPIAESVQDPTSVKLPLRVPSMKLTVPVGVVGSDKVPVTLAVQDVVCPRATVAGEQVRLRLVGSGVTVMTAWPLLASWPLSPP